MTNQTAASETFIGENYFYTVEFTGRGYWMTFQADGAEKVEKFVSCREQAMWAARELAEELAA